MIALGNFVLLFHLELLFVQFDLTSRVVLNDGLCQDTSECLVDVTHYSQAVMYLS